jgi:hypothetical protein
MRQEAGERALLVRALMSVSKGLKIGFCASHLCLVTWVSLLARSLEMYLDALDNFGPVTFDLP